MKVIEVVGKIRWQVAVVPSPGLSCVTHFLTFLQLIMQIFIRPNERARKMIRIHHLNLFRIRRSSHLFFRSTSHWAILTIRIVISIAQCDGDQKNGHQDR